MLFQIYLKTFIRLRLRKTGMPSVDSNELQGLEKELTYCVTTTLDKLFEFAYSKTKKIFVCGEQKIWTQKVSSL